MNYIISRHVGEVISHISGSVVSGATYVCVFPIPVVNEIISHGGRFLLLSLPQVVFEERGQELTPEEMGAAGAALFEMVSLNLRKKQTDRKPTTLVVGVCQGKFDWPMVDMKIGFGVCPSDEPNHVIARVDVWYDRISRNWVVQRKNAVGDQLGDADYVYTKKEAMAISHEYKALIGTMV